jgi:hypothetical protein
MGDAFGVPALETSTSLGWDDWGACRRVLVDGVLYNRTHA